MKFSKGQKMRFRCENCNSVKNVKLIHAKNSLKKTGSTKLTVGETDIFILEYKIGKHHHGTKLCSGSEKIQSKKYDGKIDLEF